MVGGDVPPGRGSHSTRGWRGDPDEIVIKFRGSKCDQFKTGCLRNLFASVVKELYPVMAMSSGHRLGKEGEQGPVMDTPGEDPVGRNEVAGVLRQAALDLGASPENLSTHSLWARGATALYAAGYGEAEITYHGRWRVGIVDGICAQDSGSQRRCGARHV